jgi:ADP-heptose:LPS heptosyltransferase
VKEAHFRNILIVNLGGIGDLLLSTPALRALKDGLKPARLSILVVPRAYDLVKALGYIDRVYVLQKRISPNCIWGNLLTLSRLRKEHFDLAINMRTIVTKRSAFMMKWLLAAIDPAMKAGRDTGGRGGFFDIRIDETDLGEKYEMEYDIEMAKALGADIADRKLKFEFSEEDLTRVKKLLEESGICADDIIVGINPGGKPSHRWPVENFIRTMREIDRRIKCKFVITGDMQDGALADILMAKAGIKLADTTGRLNIRELGALIKMCSLYISNDAGPIHIAAILKTPLVAIFGPGYLKRFDPRNISDKAVVLQGETPCAPCGRVRCGDLSCLKKITPEKVIEESLRLLA